MARRARAEVLILAKLLLYICALGWFVVALSSIRLRLLFGIAFEALLDRRYDAVVVPTNDLSRI